VKSDCGLGRERWPGREKEQVKEGRGSTKKNYLGPERESRLATAYQPSVQNLAGRRSRSRVPVQDLTVRTKAGFPDLNRRKGWSVVKRINHQEKPKYGIVGGGQPAPAPAALFTRF